jgi:hypothetical protein
VFVALACGALAACGGGVPATGPVTGAAGAPGSCQSARGGMTHANLGPDLNLQVLCGGSAIGGIASVSHEGAGSTSWTVSLSGDPEFVASDSSLLTCEASGTTVVVVKLGVPPDALPGATFDAVATIKARDGSFPTGTVKVHGEVVTPRATVAPTLDFGDVPAWTSPTQTIRFINDTTAPVLIIPDFVSRAPFTAAASGSPDMMTSTTLWFMALQPSPPGDYTVDTSWTVAPAPNLGLSDVCVSKKTVTLHAHVVAVDGGADGPPAGSDGGLDGSTLPLIIP